MSLSNPRSASPVTRYFRIKGADEDDPNFAGAVTYYDKSQSREVVVPTPFQFIVLDVVNVIGGFHKQSRSGVWSNEFRDVQKDHIVVRSNAGVLLEGVYSGDIQDRGAKYGAKFANSAYVAFKDGDGWAIGNIKFIGASLGKWIDHGKQYNVSSNPGVAITGFTKERSGTNEFFAPVFGRIDVSQDSLDEAIRLDGILQDYLSASLSRTVEAEPVATSPEPAFTPPAYTPQPLSQAAPF